MKLRDFLNTIDVYADEYEFEIKCPNGAHMKYKQAWGFAICPYTINEGGI